MLEFLQGKATDRKLRLFGVACVRRIWHLFSEEASRQFMKAAEQYPDGVTLEGDLFEACREVVEVVERYGEGLASDQEVVDAQDAANQVAWEANDFIDIDSLELWAACAAAATAYFDIHRIENPRQPQPTNVPQVGRQGFP
jgi:hypothetical protein